MGTGSPDSDPTIFRPGDARAIGKRPVEEGPVFAAVGGYRRGCAGVIGLAIVAADDHASVPIAEGDRKNANRIDACHDRRRASNPVLTSVSRMEDSRRFGSARGEPHVL